MALLKKPLLIASIIAGSAIAAYFFWPKADTTATASTQNMGQARPGGPGRAIGQARPSGPGRAMGPWAMPIPVRVVSAEPADLRVQIKTIGTVTPLNHVVVQSRVSGPLQEVLFTEGQKVEQGQLLAQIDPSDYQVQLSQAQGQLEQNLAQLKNAEQDLALYSKLRVNSSISEQQYNQQQALVNQLKGALKSNQAQIDAAKLQLSYTSINAPISGRLGLRRVDPGNLVQANSAEGLVTITQSSPISVVFSVPESQLMQVRDAVRKGEALTVEAWDRNERQMLSKGTLTNWDNQIDTSTGTLRLKAEFTNEQEELFPNQFVNVRLNVAVQKDMVTIPQDTVQYGSAGNYVYVIEDNKAQLRHITLGAVDNGMVAVLDGLQSGALVVLEGLDRLRPGRAVEVITDQPAPAK